MEYEQLVRYESELVEKWITADKDRSVEALPSLRNKPPSLLASLLQKAIRRGDHVWAVSAALALLDYNTGYPWRRIRFIAAEDISLANPALVGLVLSVAGKQSLIGKVGAAKALANIVEMMALSPKCRTACDLLLIANGHPKIRDFRAAVVQKGDDELVALYTHPFTAVWKRAAILQLIAGLSMRVGGRWETISKPRPRALRSILDRVNPDLEIRYFTLKGTRTDALSQLALLTVEPMRLAAIEFDLASDSPYSTELIDGVPAYAYCLFSEAGRKALRRFLNQSKWLGALRLKELGVRDPLRAIGSLVFQMEGSRCDRLAKSQLSEVIRRRGEVSMLEQHGVTRSIAYLLADRMGEEWRRLNDARCWSASEQKN